MQFGKWLAASTISVMCTVTAQAEVIQDVLDRKVDVDLPAERVVLGFYAEDYMAIGTEAAFDKVVGISRDTWEAWRPASWKLYTDYRPSLKDIPDVGEVESQTFSIEKVLSLKPSVVVLADWQYKGLGMDVDRLEDAGVPVIVVDYNAQTLERHLKSTEILGELTGQEDRAKQISEEYENTIVSAQKRIADAHLPKPRAYVEFGKKGPDQYSFTYGKNMWGAMLTAMGGDNIAAPFVEWWGPMNPEQVIASKPEVVFISGTESGVKGKAMVMGQGIDQKISVERLKGFANRAGWSEMPAVKNENFHGIYQGASRSILDASMAQYIAKSLYPKLFEDVNPQQGYLDFYKKYLPVAPTGTFAISITE
ncbi:ABC transporter substrate-binding protein [Marinomonas balearica]|uniref:ABC-type Fe3+-hydroxamate transport system substrate-binding protein n=1 Tax=Marinomonas balearica TaxID=491947 RepID=A0A4R6MFB4_9GAMM|nr:ABC transporter substrate-binding protein [Marinomonas balearica]TDO99440.1 ABC-type Fe3+-hydroxamate transport system substrate-binding protein [Marinomonas balearica]